MVDDFFACCLLSAVVIRISRNKVLNVDDSDMFYMGQMAHQKPQYYTNLALVVNTQLVISAGVCGGFFMETN